jgi:hypothetical protein
MMSMLTGPEAWARVRAVAFAFENFTELPPASNRGQVVDRLQSFCGLDPTDANPWCACAVYYAGYYGLYDPTTKKSAWPCLKTAGCAQLGAWASEHKILRTTPQEGDIFLLWYPKLERFAHTGFVINKASALTWGTLEGNTSKPGDTNPATIREGWGWFSRTRTFGERDRFVRWTDLLPAPVLA